MSPVCGSRAEREKACPETAASACGERECRSRECPVVTCVPSPWRAGGPARSSDEAPVTGAERRGRVVRGCCSSVNRRYREESRGRAESIWQAVPDLKGRGLGRLDQGEREQGRTRGGRAVLPAALFAHDLAAFGVDGPAGLGGDDCMLAFCGGKLASAG